MSPDPTTERIAIVGLGRLGSQLAVWLAAAGMPPVALVSSRPDHAAAVAARIATRPAIFTTTDQLAALSPAPTIIFLAVPDSELAALAAKLAALPALTKSHPAALHSAGAQPAAILAPLAAVGCATGCFHPLQSFGPLAPDDAATGSPFRGVTIGIEADHELAARLATIATKLSCYTITLPSDPRIRANYHAAAVVASNALCGLTDVAIELMARAGIPPAEAQRALLPLVMGTLFNLLRMPPGAALTGPVARGDHATIGTHLGALSDDPALAALYSNLTARLLLLALRSKRIDEAKARAISDELLKRLAAVNTPADQ